MFSFCLCSTDRSFIIQSFIDTECLLAVSTQFKTKVVTIIVVTIIVVAAMIVIVASVVTVTDCYC